MNSNPRSDAELLSDIYKSVRTGADNLCTVTPKITDRFMLTEVTSQIERYSEYAKKTEKMMRERSLAPREPSFASRLISRGAIAVGSFPGTGRSEIAGMIARGENRDARRLGEKLEKCSREGCHPDVSSLCREVIGFELNGAEKMKDYLS